MDREEIKEIDEICGAVNLRRVYAEADAQLRQKQTIEKLSKEIKTKAEEGRLAAIRSAQALHRLEQALLETESRRDAVKHYTDRAHERAFSLAAAIPAVHFREVRFLIGRTVETEVSFDEAMPALRQAVLRVWVDFEEGR